MNRTIDTACRVHVLAVSPFESDRVALAHIFGHTAWELDTARTVEEASLKLFHARLAVAPPVILCDEAMPDGTWKDVLRLTEQVAEPNYLIVTSHLADDHLWAEVLNLGAYDVLAKPFQAQEVFRAVGLAWRHWTDRRKMASRSESRTTTALVANAVA